MAPGKNKKKPPVRKKKRPLGKKSAGSHFIRSIISLGLLLAIVGATGITARHLLARKPPSSSPEPVFAGLKKTRFTPPPQSPIYEIYPKKDSHPPLETKRSLARKVATDTTPIAPLEELKKARDSIMPQVAIIIDDIGYDPRIVDRFLSIDAPLTFSVLPFSPYQKKIIGKIRAKNREVMLHLPMEPVEYPKVNPGPGTLLASMTPGELTDRLTDALDTIPGVIGVNNHMGSKFTTHSEQMHQVLKILKQRGLFFIDSRTSYHTVSRELSRKLGLPYARRRVFLDNSTEPEKIKIQLEKLIRYAKKRGEAIGIGHPHGETFHVLAREIPKLKRQIRFVPASRMVHIIDR